MAMLMRAELPIEYGRMNDMLVNELLMLAVFTAIGGAVAIGLSIGFPIPADIAAEWLTKFPG
jgi:hypothetical protein